MSLIVYVSRKMMLKPNSVFVGIYVPQAICIATVFDIHSGSTCFLCPCEHQ
uniref:Uncharacterized protein n=1 Tax=Arundo donax TaxID=35708 RepID=A0A0A9C8N7_ARUDO